jgi:hypothetical protein
MHMCVANAGRHIAQRFLNSGLAYDASKDRLRAYHDGFDTASAANIQRATKREGDTWLVQPFIQTGGAVGKPVGKNVIPLFSLDSVERAAAPNRKLDNDGKAREGNPTAPPTRQPTRRVTNWKQIGIRTENARYSTHSLTPSLTRRNCEAEQVRSQADDGAPAEPAGGKSNHVLWAG